MSANSLPIRKNYRATPGQRVNRCISIDKKVDEAMRDFPHINWSLIAEEAFQKAITRLEKLEPK